MLKTADAMYATAQNDYTRAQLAYAQHFMAAVMDIESKIPAVWKEMEIKDPNVIAALRAAIEEWCERQVKYQ